MVHADPTLPLCVDLDGTLVRSDTLWVLLAKLMRQRPWKLFSVLMTWVCHGNANRRAAFKHALSALVSLDPATLPYHQALLTDLRTAHAQGRTLVLATGADMRVAQTVARHLGIFHHVIASDGIENCVRSRKARRLCALFGVHKFVYAGNAWADVPVWKKSAGIVLVQAPARLVRFVQKRYPSKILRILP